MPKRRKTTAPFTGPVRRRCASRFEAMKEIWNQGQAAIPRRGRQLSADDDLAQAGCRKTASCRRSSSAAPSASPRGVRSATATVCFPRRRAPARAAPRSFMPRLRSDGRRSRTRPAIAVGDVGRRARGRRCIEAQPRSRRYPHDRPPAAGQGSEILPILDRWAKLIPQVRN